MAFNFSVPSLNGTTWIPIVDCTLGLCSLDYAQVRYDPTLVGNTLYLAIFAVFLCIQVFQGITSRTWTFMGAMIGGMILEIIGYAARIQMHYNPFRSDPFLMFVHQTSPLPSPCSIPISRRGYHVLIPCAGISSA
jgi:hypothetical protein